MKGAEDVGGVFAQILQHWIQSLVLQNQQWLKKNYDDSSVVKVNAMKVWWSEFSPQLSLKKWGLLSFLEIAELGK